MRLQIKLRNIEILFIMIVLSLSLAYGIGISPATKILEGDSYTITIVGEPGQYVELSAPEPVTLSAYELTLPSTGKNSVKVYVDFEKLIPGENIMYINALTKPQGDGQLVVVTEVGHKLSVYSDSDDDYVEYKSFNDKVRKSIGVFGRVLSLNTINQIRLDIYIGDIQKTLYKYAIEPQKEFEISALYDDLGLEEGYWEADMLLRYGEQQKYANISFTIGEPRVSGVKAHILSVEKGITTVQVDFSFDWNREQQLQAGSLILSSASGIFTTSLPAMIIVPGKNSQIVYYSNEMSLENYKAELYMELPDGNIKVEGKLVSESSAEKEGAGTKREKEVEEKPDLMIKIMWILLVVLIMLALWTFRGSIRGFLGNLFKKKIRIKKKKAYKRQIPRHKKIKW